MTAINPPDLSGSDQILTIDDWASDFSDWLTAAIHRDDSVGLTLKGLVTAFRAGAGETHTYVGSAFTTANGYMRGYVGIGIYWDSPATQWVNTAFGSTNGWMLFAADQDGNLLVFSDTSTGSSGRTYTAAQVQAKKTGALHAGGEFDAVTDLIARPGLSSRVGIGDVGGGSAGILFGGPSADTTLKRTAAGVLDLSAAAAAGLSIAAGGTSQAATLALASRSAGGAQQIGAVAVDAAGKMYIAPGVAAQGVTFTTPGIFIDAAAASSAATLALTGRDGSNVPHAGTVAVDAAGKMYIAPGVAAQGITFTTPGVAVDAAVASSAAAIYLAGRDGSNTQLVGSVSVDAAGKMHIVPGVAAQGAFFATALVAIDPAVANSSAGLLIVGRNGSNTPLNGAISVDQAGKMVLVPGVAAQGVTISSGLATIDPAVASTAAGLAIFARDAGNAQKGAAFSVNLSGDATIDTAVAGRSMVLGSTPTNKLGFYGATGAVKQTGVAVTAAGIHAALVAVGLIAP